MGRGVEGIRINWEVFLKYVDLGFKLGNFDLVNLIWVLRVCSWGMLYLFWEY